MSDHLFVHSLHGNCYGGALFSEDTVILWSNVWTDNSVTYNGIPAHGAGGGAVAGYYKVVATDNRFANNRVILGNPQSTSMHPSLTVIIGCASINLLLAMNTWELTLSCFCCVVMLPFRWIAWGSDSMHWRSFRGEMCFLQQQRRRRWCGAGSGWCYLYDRWRGGSCLGILLQFNCC